MSTTHFAIDLRQKAICGATDANPAAGTLTNRRAKTTCPACNAQIEAAAHRAPPTKLELLRAAIQRENWPLAFRIAAKFHDLGDPETAKAIRNANEAIQRPAFFQQLGKDPAAMLETGIAALKRRYRIA